MPEPTREEAKDEELKWFRAHYAALSICGHHETDQEETDNGTCVYCQLAEKDMQIHEAAVRIIDADSALKTAQEQIERLDTDLTRSLAAQRDYENANTKLEESLAESSEVCVCGCPPADHESYGEDGESCGKDHECIRTCIAIRDMLAKKDRQIEIAQSDANDWKQGMAGQEDRALDLEGKLQQAEAALKHYADPLSWAGNAKGYDEWVCGAHGQAIARDYFRMAAAIAKAQKEKA